MKKKNIELGKKIFLHKKTIAALNAGKVVGGGTTPPSKCQSCNTVCEIPLTPSLKCATTICQPTNNNTYPEGGMYC